jgi:hypothetical protein
MGPFPLQIPSVGLVFFWGVFAVGLCLFLGFWDNPLEE